MEIELKFFWIGVLFATLGAATASAQLRIVTYNTLHSSPRSQLFTVLQAIGEEHVNDIAKPVDILLLQEQDEPFTTTQAIVNGLNNIYGAGTYARGSVATGPSFSSLRQSVVYHTGSVERLEEIAVRRQTINGSTPPRESQRIKFRPVGYDSSADFYIYNSHFKAGSSSSDIARRNAEAVTLRDNADRLGADTPVIFAGDFNLRNDGSSNSLSSPAEPAFQTLIGPGAAQSFDPVADIAPAQWKNNFSARFVHTHGGNEVDDRFDFQLPSEEWRDGEGLDIINGSYRAFGNNGSTYNDPIDRGNTISFDFGTDPSFTTPQVLSALNDASDHLPVVVDYQLPSILSASVVDLESEVFQGEQASFTLSVENVASVVSDLGADELDFQIMLSGAVEMTFSGSDLADGIAREFVTPLATSTVGLHTIEALVTSDGQGLGGSQAQFTLQYSVLAQPLAGDFNDDGLVDGADYAVWRNGFGDNYTIDQLDEWRSAFGDGSATAVGSAVAARVPEPLTLLGLLFGVVPLSAVRRR